MIYWLITNEWFSAWATDGNFSLQSHVRQGIYILKHTDINQAQTLPALVLELQDCSTAACRDLFPQQPPAHSLLCCLEHCKPSPAMLCWESALLKEEHLAGAVQDMQTNMWKLVKPPWG